MSQADTLSAPPSQPAAIEPPVCRCGAAIDKRSGLELAPGRWRCGNCLRAKAAVASRLLTMKKLP